MAKTILTDKSPQEAALQCPACGAPLERRPGSRQLWCSVCGWTQPKKGGEFAPPEEWDKFNKGKT